MKKFKNIAKEFIVKYGTTIAAVAFVFVTVSSNTSCGYIFYEPVEPKGLAKFKKFNR